VVYVILMWIFFLFFSSRRRHTRSKRDWSSDVCSSDLDLISAIGTEITENQAYQLISSLYEDGVFSRKEANYVLAAISRQALDLPTAEMENMIRARILVSILNQLRCEE